MNRPETPIRVRRRLYLPLLMAGLFATFGCSSSASADEGDPQRDGGNQQAQPDNGDDAVELTLSVTPARAFESSRAEVRVMNTSDEAVLVLDVSLTAPGKGDMITEPLSTTRRAIQTDDGYRLHAEIHDASQRMMHAAMELPPPDWHWLGDAELVTARLLPPGESLGYSRSWRPSYEQAGEVQASVSWVPASAVQLYFAATGTIGEVNGGDRGDGPDPRAMHPDTPPLRPDPLNARRGPADAEATIDYRPVDAPQSTDASQQVLLKARDAGDDDDGDRQPPIQRLAPPTPMEMIYVHAITAGAAKANADHAARRAELVLAHWDPDVDAARASAGVADGPYMRAIPTAAWVLRDRAADETVFVLDDGGMLRVGGDLLVLARELNRRSTAALEYRDPRDPRDTPEEPDLPGLELRKIVQKDGSVRWLLEIDADDLLAVARTLSDLGMSADAHTFGPPE